MNSSFPAHIHPRSGSVDAFGTGPYQHGRICNRCGHATIERFRSEDEAYAAFMRDIVDPPSCRVCGLQPSETERKRAEHALKNQRRCNGRERFMRLRNVVGEEPVAELFPNGPEDAPLAERQGSWHEIGFGHEMRDSKGAVVRRRGCLVAPLRPDAWLFCLWCKRFCQGRDTLPDDFGAMQQCPFCPAAGFDVALHPWDWWREPGWPSRDALRRGLEHWPTRN